jgi:hypothetical protein
MGASRMVCKFHAYVARSYWFLGYIFVIWKFDGNQKNLGNWILSFENTYILKTYDTIEKFANAEHVSPCI